MNNKAIGFIEVIGYTNAVVAADECVKAASVNLLGIEKVSGGIVTVKIIGDVGAVTAAVESGKAKVENTGTFRAAHVIPRLHEEVLSIVESKTEVTEVLSENKMDETTEVVIEEVQLNNTEVIEETTDEALEEVLQEKVEEKIEENFDIESNKNTEDKYSNLTVKELRQLAVSTKAARTWKEAKQLKKQELVARLLKKEEERK